MPQQPFLSVKDLLGQVIGYLPSFLSGLLVVLVGFAVAWVSAKIVVRLLIFLRVDRLVGRLRVGHALEKGDVRHALFGIVGTGVGVLVFLIFLESALTLWRLTVLSRLLEELVFLIPDLVVATIIMLAGAAVASAVARSVRRALYEEEIERAPLVSRIVRAAILVFAAAMALLQLKLASTLVQQAFLLAFGALAAAFVLAFGLGSKRAVEQMWEGLLERRRKEREGGA